MKKSKPAPVVRADRVLINALSKCMCQGFIFGSDGRVFLPAACRRLEQAYANYFVARSKP